MEAVGVVASDTSGICSSSSFKILFLLLFGLFILLFCVQNHYINILKAAYKFSVQSVGVGMEEAARREVSCVCLCLGERSCEVIVC